MLTGGRPLLMTKFTGGGGENINGHKDEGLLQRIFSRGFSV